MSSIEILGIVASAIILLSTLFKSVVHMRALNLVGAILFCIYGILINSPSLWVLNGGIIIIQTYQIIKFMIQKKLKVRCYEL